MKELQTSNFKIPSKSQIQNSKNYEKPYNLRERLFLFSKRILEICKILADNKDCEGILKQLMRAGTAIGANFEEADGTLTKKDFVNKVGIARKEAKETRYWLRLICDDYIEGQKVSLEIRECEEIINILSAMLKKSGHVRRC